MDYPDRTTNEMETKTCNTCGKTKDKRADFYPSYGMADGRQSRCKACQKISRDASRRRMEKRKAALSAEQGK